MKQQEKPKINAKNTCFSRFLFYLFQRTTLLGFTFIITGSAGVYFGLLDEKTATFLLILGAGGLIPENWPITHRILNLIAPLLVHEIKQKSSSLKNQKRISNLSASFQGAGFLLNSVLAGLPSRKTKSLFKFPIGKLGFSPDLTLKNNLKENFMTDLNTRSTEPNTLSPAPVKESTPSIMNIEAQIEEIIANALGDKLSAGEKAKIHAVGTLLGSVIGVLLPFAESAIDLDGLKEGLFTLNAGFLQEEAGLKQVFESLKKK